MISHNPYNLWNLFLNLPPQALESCRLEVCEQQATNAAAEMMLSQCRVEGAAALLAMRERLSEAHDVDRRLLLREMGEMGARGEGARRAAAQGEWLCAHIHQK